MKQKNKKADSYYVPIRLGMLLSTSGASLLGTLLTVKRVKRSEIHGQGVMRAGEGTIRAGRDF